MTEPEDLTAVLGRMTVGELARRFDLGVAELVLAVLQRRAPTQTPRASRAPRSKAAADRPPTRRELHYAVDRWLVGELFEQEAGNVSAVSRRLDHHRARIRKVWARVRNLDADAIDERFARLGGSRKPPSKAKLRALGSHRAVHDAIDRWLIEVVLEQEHGNVSKAAARLGVSRRVVRRLRDELAAR